MTVVVNIEEHEKMVYKDKDAINSHRYFDKAITKIILSARGHS